MKLEYLKKCEETEGEHFTMMIAQRSIVNSLVLRYVNKRRVADDKPKCPLYCFVHGAALKMYERGCKSQTKLQRSSKG